MLAAEFPEGLLCMLMYLFVDLVGGLEHFSFFHILGIKIPTD